MRRHGLRGQPPCERPTELPCSRDLCWAESAVVQRGGDERPVTAHIGKSRQVFQPTNPATRQDRRPQCGCTHPVDQLNVWPRAGADAREVDDNHGTRAHVGRARGHDVRRLAQREGFGDVLAEGVKRAAEKIGGEALNCAVFTQKGSSPRGHDHRARWDELIDTCLSNTGTVESMGGSPQPLDLGLEPVQDPFNPEEVSTLNAKLNGRRLFEDSLCVCRFCMEGFQNEVDALNAATGWDLTISGAMEVGRRILNQLRVFNFRHGLTKEVEAPSVRYGSAPVDGPAKGIAITPHWDFVRRNYYQHMGWDPETGKPLPETLRSLGLEECISELKQK